MKRNLNNLKKLISEFCSESTKDGRLNLLDEILFFENKKEITPFFNEKTQCVELHNVRSAKLQTATRSYKPGTTFIRARKIDGVLRNPIWQDFWEPPPEMTKKFRLNQHGEAVLYVTCDTLTARKEIKSKLNDIYNLSIYRAIDSIEVTEFGFPLSGKRTKIARTIEGFFHDLLTNKSSAIYDVSNFIAKRYFSLSRDGWVYPSIANEYRGENLCLSAESKNKLALIGAFSFCGDTPIASYDITDHAAIKVSTPEEAEKTWAEFIQNSNAFGKITATLDPEPLFMIKRICELNT